MGFYFVVIELLGKLAEGFWMGLKLVELFPVLSWLLPVLGRLLQISLCETPLTIYHYALTIYHYTLTIK